MLSAIDVVTDGGAGVSNITKNVENAKSSCLRPRRSVCKQKCQGIFIQNGKKFINNK